MRVAVLVSGGGTNLQALLDKKAQGVLPDVEFVCVIASKDGVYALERAKNHGVEALALPRKKFKSASEYSNALLAELKAREVDVVVLAGFLSILSAEFCRAYENRIINVHPSLIPSFCGDGFYGLKVHEEALKYGVKVTGATVHFVNEVTDGGRIILQKAVYIQEGDTAEVLQERVMREAEWEILPQAVQLVCKELEAKK